MMKQAALWGMGMALTATLAYGQASLPASYAGPWSTLPTGWTKQGTKTYGTDYDGGGEGSAKFDGSGDRIEVNYSGSAAEVSYYIQGNGLSGSYTYKIQESPNGSSWTDVVVYNPGNPIQNGSAAQKTNTLLSASRYVKFLYVTKATGNVGLDGVSIEGPGAPSITFDPSGSQSIAVSNLLTLAVSITPPGSGMSTWSLLTGYAGDSSLDDGTFEMTPVAADANKTFTLSVVATNAIGTTTGAVQISVTPYTPPVPVIGFSPEAPYSIMATQTQALGVAVSPEGSGIDSWEMLPAYAGSANLVGTNFTFVSAEADGPETYTLSVVATNVFGATTGTAEIAVMEYVPPPVPGSYIASFEDGSKPGYAAANVTLSNKVWEMAGILIGSSENDKKIGSKSARLKYDSTEVQAMTSQSTLLNNGIGTIALWYAPYGTHGEDAPVLAIEISAALESGWIQIGEVEVGAVTELTYASFDVYVSEPIYVRIRAISGSNNRSASFDNITITPYTSPASTPYEAFLLEYNVTPGDPGTAPAEDWDGDGYSNTNEFDAATNPYDADSHP